MFEHLTRVAAKVCGVSSAADAIICASSGVEMIGLNFSPQSLRCIAASCAAEIIAAVRPVFPQTKFVGVFVNQKIDFVRRIAKDLALDAVQLHGEESADYVRDLRAPSVIKAVRVGPHYSASKAADYNCDAILLDSWSPDKGGGTGEIFDWSIAAALRPRVKRLILAGGLTPENIADAVRAVQPFAVDVCSGIEDSHRRKNPDKLRRFISALRATEAVNVELRV
jgi:phosphoribosylanthranilate isomerase